MKKLMISALLLFMYVVEDITGTHTDPYHYKMYFHTELPVTVETKR